MKYILLTCFEVILFLLFSYVYIYAVENFKLIEPSRKSFLGRFLNQMNFLTMINIFLLTVYFGISTFILHVNSYVVQSIRSSLLSTLMTSGWFVTLIFWGLYFYDRDLVFPKYLDGMIPQWWNFAAHLLNAIAITSELIIIRPKAKPTKLSYCFIGILTVGYLLLVEYNIVVNQFHVYPIFKVLSTSQRYVFSCTLVVIMLILFIFFNTIVTKIASNKKQIKPQSSKPTKSTNVKQKPTVSKSNQPTSGIPTRRKIRKD